jgi:hypothetical protein
MKMYGYNLTTMPFNHAGNCLDATILRSLLQRFGRALMKW